MTPGAATFNRYQKFVIAMLAFLQFTIILDFMVLSPLGAIIMPTLNISPSQFGLVVSAYAFSAGSGGFLAAGFADHYDRKKLLLFFYVGFVVGTLLCGLAPTYQFLLAARMVTGIFGGVIGSIVGAIVTDLFPFEVRGRVMGILQTAFAASQILGLPAGLYFANHWGWHAPFLMIVFVSIFAGFAIWLRMKPVNAHLKMEKDKTAFEHLIHTLTIRRHLLGFSATALLSIGGFMMMPFGSAFTVNNLKISMDRLPLIYLVTGLTAIVTGPLIGRVSDRIGKYKTFALGSLFSGIMVLVYTNLGPSPLALVMLVNTLLMTGIFSRMIPGMALMSALPARANRGAFMSISSSLQQLAGGVAALIAGAIVVQSPEGRLEHFNWVGYVMVATFTVSLAMMFFIHKAVPEHPE